MNDAVENATALFQTEFLFLDGILKYLVFLTVEIVVFLHEFMKCRPVDFFLLGKLLDGADMNIAFSKLNNQAARMPNVNLNTTAMYAGGGLSAGGLAGATVVEMLVSMSGLGAKFNKALVGDERGVCIPMGPGGCDNWKKYEQILVFETTVTGVGASPVTFVTRARTLSEELKPIDLLNEVMPAYITAMTKE